MEYARGVIQALVDQHKAPGLSLAVVRDGRVEIAEGWGRTRAGAGDPVGPRTRFGLGSVSKSFTSALLASLLQDRTDVTWDTPLKDIFGVDLSFGEEFRTSRACLRDILAHKMGVELGECDFGWMFEPFERSVIPHHTKFLPYAADFRTKMMYNNFMYVLAGQVAEKLGGATWEELVKSRLFDVIGMSDAGFLDKEWPEGRDLATPHMAVHKEPIPIDTEIHRSSCVIGPAGSICASAEDMAKWMMFHLAEGAVDGVSVIKPRFLKECHLPQFALPHGKPEWSGYCRRPAFPATETRDAYCFGWYTGTYREFRSVCHSGELFGYDTLVTLYPEANVGIYTCINGPAGEPAFTSSQLMHYALSDAMLHLPPWLDPKTACTFPQPWKDRQPYFPEKINTDIQKDIPASRPLADYVGTFQNGFLGDIHISVEDGTLFMSYGKHGKFKLYANGISSDEFRMEGQGSVSFLHKVDVNSPSDWMTVKFDASAGREISELFCALFESGPCFSKV